MLGNLHSSNILKPGEFIGRLCKEIDLAECSIKEFVDRTEDSIPRHTHEDAHFLLIIEGRYLTSARGVSPVTKSSTLIFNPSGTTHRDRFQEGGRFLAVSLKTGTPGRRSKTDLIDHPVGFDGGEVAWLGWKLYREFQRPDEMSSLVMTGVVLEILGHVWRGHARDRHSGPPWLRVAHELIHDRFVEPLTIGEIAQAVGVHPVYLVRAFRKHYGLTVGEYLRKLRVDLACRQISGTSVPLSQIAAAAGFYDQSHFTRTFKRMVGITPHEYRSISRTHRFVGYK